MGEPIAPAHLQIHSYGTEYMSLIGYSYLDGTLCTFHVPQALFACRVQLLSTQHSPEHVKPPQAQSCSWVF